MGFLVSLITSLIAILIYLNTGRISDERSRLAIRTILILIGSIAVLNSFSRLLVIVPPGNVGVVNFFGEVSETTLNPGVHLLNPFSKVLILSHVEAQREIGQIMTLLTAKA
ncbi:SPFH domain-containing protein [Nostoc sp.]|uniref:SPFH domain-containing protein n=1 Tax=Nostoc sp. TaxID=1180 RepID=UPI002FFC0F8F